MIEREKSVFFELINVKARTHYLMMQIWMEDNAISKWIHNKNKTYLDLKWC